MVGIPTKLSDKGGWPVEPFFPAAESGPLTCPKYRASPCPRFEWVVGVLSCQDWIVSFPRQSLARRRARNIVQVHAHALNGSWECYIMSSGLDWERFGVITGGDEVCILPPHPLLSISLFFKPKTALGRSIKSCIYF